MNYQETSREAWRRFAVVSGSVDDRIIRALQEAGESGLTDEEVERRLGEKHQTVSGNRRHLAERGLVKDSGLRGVTSSGRAAIKWVLTNLPTSPSEHYCHCGKRGNFGFKDAWFCGIHRPVRAA